MLQRNDQGLCRNVTFYRAKRTKMDTAGSRRKINLPSQKNIGNAGITTQLQTLSATAKQVSGKGRFTSEKYPGKISMLQQASSDS